jgi:hypothetical protein
LLEKTEVALERALKLDAAARERRRIGHDDVKGAAAFQEGKNVLLDPLEYLRAKSRVPSDALPCRLNRFF